MKKLVFILVELTSIISFLVAAVNNSNISNEFGLVLLYPLIYGVLAALLWPYLRDKSCGSRITAGIFLALQWLRAVLHPALGAISGYFKVDAGLVDTASASTASILFLFELVVTFGVVYLLLRFSKKELRPEEKSMELSGNVLIYILFIAVAFGLYVWKGRGMYTFFSLDPTSDDRASEMELGVGMEIRAIIGYGLTFIVILLIYYCYKRYLATKKKRYMYYALLTSLARICIISAGSEGRLAVLYPVGVSLLLLPRLFTEHRKTIIRSVALLGVVVLGLMTLYKVFHAFLYDSYLETLQNTIVTFDVHDASTQIDIYFYGVRNIAKNIYVSRYLDLDISTFFVDIFRNTFGVHFLLDEYTNSTTVALYNLFIYSGEQAAGHLYSSLAYGNSYFSVALAPFATAFNIFLVAALEKWLRRMKNIDSIYIVGLVYTRMAYNMFACFPLAWNNASRTLILGFLIIGGATLLKNSRRRAGLKEE